MLEGIGKAVAPKDVAGVPPQTWNPDGYARNARFVADLGRAVVDLLAVRPGERVLDLGCGDGVLTAELAARGARVLGIDASPEMVAAARRRGVEALILDGHALAEPERIAELLGEAGPFDAVFSNAALHWMTQPDRVLAGVARVLRPGGRFVGEFGGAGNVARILQGLRAALERRGHAGARFEPWYFPEPADYQARLQAAGFTVRVLELFERPTPLPTGVTGWLATFTQPFFHGLALAEREAVLAEIVSALAPQLCDATGQWWADYVRLRFSATL